MHNLCLLKCRPGSCGKHCSCCVEGGADNSYIAGTRNFSKKFQEWIQTWFLIQFKNLLNLHEKSPRLAKAESSAPGSPLSKHIQHITMSHFTLTSNRAYSISSSTVGAFNRRSTHRYISISHISLKFTFFSSVAVPLLLLNHISTNTKQIDWFIGLQSFAFLRLALCSQTCIRAEHIGSLFAGVLLRFTFMCLEKMQ